MGAEANGAEQTPTETMQESVEELPEHFIWLLAIGHLDIMEYLIGCGVLPHDQDVNAYNIEMNTPLHWACLKGHVEVVKNLFLSGANTSLLNSHEWTPIDEAVTMGKMDVIDAINATIAELELTGVNVS